MNFAEMRVGNVSVDLGCTNICVAEKGLYRANIGTVHKKISGKAVTKRVRGNMLCNAGFSGVTLDDTFD